MNLMEVKKQYKVSIIMAVYNTEKYLKDAILSIINQTIGFEENVQLILVDDGSIDTSREICYEFHEKYSSNIVFLTQANSGVSVARNYGLEHAEGKFINFLDSDDKLGLTTLYNANVYFSANKHVDVLATRLSLFDGGKGDHPLNFKYDKYKNKTVDLDIDYEAIQMNVSSVFFRKSAIGNIRFDTEMKFAEDSKFYFDVIKSNPKLGLLSYKKGCYWYRKRQGEKSTMDRTLTTKEYYLSTVKKFHNYLVASIENNKVPEYIQMMLMYDMQWRIGMNPEKIKVLTSSEKKEYFKCLENLLEYIDEKIIMSERIKNISQVTKIGIIKHKNKNDKLMIKKEGEYEALFIGDTFIKRVREMYLQIDSLYLKNDRLHVACTLPSFDTSSIVKPVLVINDSEIISESKSYKLTQQYILGEWNSSNIYYRFDIDINKDIKKIEIKYSVNSDTELINIYNISNPQKTNFINKKKYFENNYKNLNVTFIRENQKIELSENNVKTKYSDAMYLFKLLKNPKTRNAGVYRAYSKIVKPFTRKNIWLFMDRVNLASDNAEQSFRYAVKNNKTINSYFIIEKGNDYNRLNKEFPGKIVEYHSIKHHKLVLLANKFFTSHAEDYLFNPFGNTNGRLNADLLSFEFIFLQHGVIQNDLSRWLSKKNKPLIDRFVTTSKIERNSILSSYGFNEDEIILTGLPRYDNFEVKKIANDKHVIAFMPTWRADLTLSNMDENEFYKSDYFKFINGIFKNNKLKSILKSSNVELQLFQHPRMSEFYKDAFESSTQIKMINDFMYKDTIKQADALITDISSVAFDFAVQKKPLVYAHFDIDKLYKTASYKEGYFNYFNHGFGDVVYTVEELVDNLDKIVNHNFKMTKKYQKRTEVFFENIDNKNTERLMQLVTEEKRAIPNPIIIQKAVKQDSMKNSIGEKNSI